ncbi:Crp/Fnr family transcriptional regulator [Ferruginibacter sp.]
MFQQFKNKFPLGNDKWNNYSNCFNELKVAAKTTLLKEGQVSKKLFIIEKGCIRAWFNNNGKDISFQFFFENSVVSSVESFRKSIPSPVTLETIEPSTIWWIHKKDWDRIVEEMMDTPALRSMFLDATYERTYHYMQHFFSSIKDTPQQRYINLIKEKPQIVKRIPQHYIASYLGITTVHLSRIKNKIYKEKKG